MDADRPSETLAELDPGDVARDSIVHLPGQPSGKRFQSLFAEPVVADRPGPFVVAGDGFAGAKVEGAFLSGLDAADRVLAAAAAMAQEPTGP